jgi:MFS superfamily sulfate permease-like transporter
MSASSVSSVPQTLSNTWEEITKYDTSYLATFIFGFLLKEILYFIKEGGLGDDYPLSRSLFLMFMCLVSFYLLAIPHFFRLKEEILKIKNLFFSLNKTQETNLKAIS